jgi:peptidoglycan/xylan/chitin deacetylase (PgdA/CDA1 family)
MKAWSVGAVGAVAGAAVWSAPAPAPIIPRVASALGIRTRLATSHGVALTFDDGPHLEGTPATLDALATVRATATFFLVGEQIERYPTLAAEIAAAGHEVGLHGYRHRLLLRRRPREVEDDLLRACARIEDATGTSPVCYRPPYGVFSFPALAWCRRLGWEPMLWSRWGRDWGPREKPAAIAQRATSNLGAGDVVLLHDADHYSSPGSWRRTVAALPSVFASVLALGEPFVSVTQST